MTFLIKYLNDKATSNGKTYEMKEYPIRVDDSIIDNVAEAWRKWKRVRHEFGPAMGIRLEN